MGVEEKLGEGPIAKVARKCKCTEFGHFGGLGKRQGSDLAPVLPSPVILGNGCHTSIHMLFPRPFRKTG